MPSTSRMWLLRSHPNFFISYQGAVVAMLGTGLISATADETGPVNPVLRFYYQAFGIHTWGWLFIAVGVLMVVGLFRATFGLARLALAGATLLLSVRLALQLQAAAATWLGEGWDGAAGQVAGLPILYLAVCALVAMTREPPLNPSTAR